MFLVLLLLLLVLFVVYGNGMINVMCLAVLSYVSVSVPSGWLFHPWQSVSVLCV